MFSQNQLLMCVSKHYLRNRLLCQWCTSPLFKTRDYCSCITEHQLIPKVRSRWIVRSLIAKGYQTYYLPYTQESIEEVKEYDHLINFINSLAKHGDNKSDEKRILYNECIQIQTKYIPLDVTLDRKEFIHDWNEVMTVITEMGVVPEEADQVSLQENLIFYENELEEYIKITFYIQ